MSGFAPVGNHPIAAFPAPLLTIAVDEIEFDEDAIGNVVRILREALRLSSALKRCVRVSLAGQVQLTSPLVGTAVKPLRDAIRLTGSPFGALTLHPHVAEQIRFSGAMVVIWRMLVDEEINVVGDVAGSPSKYMRLLDTLVATGLIHTHSEARATLTAALAINGMAASGWHATAADTIGFQEAFFEHVRSVNALLDTLELDASAAPSLRIMALADGHLALDDSALPHLAIKETTREDLLLYGAIRLGDDEYVGWVLNEGAPSEYRNFPFNGFTAFNGRYYGTSREGLYLLEGDTDDGDPITASIKTALMDFGTGVLKRLPDVYVAFVGGDTVLLKVITTGQRGEQVETLYTASVPAGAAMHNVNIRIGQGLTSRYWQFELTNVDGAEFEIDELAWRPMTLDRRV